jgi:hypothetical protein
VRVESDGTHSEEVSVPAKNLTMEQQQSDRIDSPAAGRDDGVKAVEPPVRLFEGHVPDAPSDPFDPARLRLDQDYETKAGVTKLLTTIPVRKPSRESFVRTHPDPEYRLTTGVLELKEDREVYLVAPSLWPALAAEPTFSPKMLVTSVTRQGVLFLWPIRLPGPDGKVDEWSRSSLEAADLARENWVRLASNMNLGAYEITQGSGIGVEPDFPDLPMREILRIAFRNHFIDTVDHPVLRRLRGEV